MGFFSKDQGKIDAKARDMLDKSRAKAQKKGIDVADAIAVGSTFDDGAEQYLVVFADRVELVNRGKAGTLFKKGAGVETIPTSRISSVQCKNKGIWAHLEIFTSGNTIEFKTDQSTGPLLRQIILDQAGGSTPTPTSAAGAADVADQIRRLSELHQSGILTDDEFATKKAELLDRI